MATWAVEGAIFPLATPHKEQTLHGNLTCVANYGGAIVLGTVAGHLLECREGVVRRIEAHEHSVTAIATNTRSLAT